MRISASDCSAPTSSAPCSVVARKYRFWNRSPDKARALEAEGAKAFDRVEDAVRGATRIHLTLSDDAAVDDVLERARPGFAPGVVILNHTTTSPRGTSARAKRLEAAGIAFLHAPVFMGPPNALDATGVMLASGPQERIEMVRAELEKMTGKLMYLGAEPGRAAVFKLLGNLFLIEMMAGVSDVFALAKASGVAGADAATLFEVFNPAAMIGPRLKRMLEAKFNEASFSLEMARKDVRLMLESAAQGGQQLAALPGIAAQMDLFLSRGHAKDDWTVIATDAVTKK